ncbi:hypothetical protein DSM112329_05158 [Paraconexibacter sp. AEG42_29]|uniref:Peroxide stress protein YaaA n=1 Tax=Paraconexibacter sp. AEG42_29 TaxID=2997339 RepID=A0AAU7B2N6_9ACTN
MSAQQLLIALPPSEGKATGGDGPPLELAGLSSPGELTAARERVLRSLVKVCSVTSPRAVTRVRGVLGLPVGLAGELAVNAALRSAPTLPAAARYTGVLYDHLGLSTLPPAARERAASRVAIVSGLWGVVRPDDAIPAYRLSMNVTLPGVGRLGTFWRAPLAAALPDDALVVDCRSAAYAAAWKPPAGCTVLAVRVFTVAPDGTRSVVSHMAKATRGDVARLLLTRPSGADADPGTPGDVAALVSAAGLRCELVRPARPGGGAAAPWFLDVLLTT